MKKYFSAQFMLECIIPDDCDKPDYVLRDQRGNICCRGDVDDVVNFLDEMFVQFKNQKSNGDGTGEN